MKTKTIVAIAFLAVVVVIGSTAHWNYDREAGLLLPPAKIAEVKKPAENPASAYETGLVSRGILDGIIVDSIGDELAKRDALIAALQKDLAVVKNRQLKLDTRGMAETIKNKFQDRFAPSPAPVSSAPAITPSSDSVELPATAPMPRERPRTRIQSEAVPPPPPPAWSPSDLAARPETRWKPHMPHVGRAAAAPGPVSLAGWNRFGLDKRVALVKEICRGRELPAGYTEEDVMQQYKDASYDKIVDFLAENCGYIPPARRSSEVDDQRPYKVAGKVVARGKWSPQDDSQLNEMLARKSQHVLQDVPKKRNHRGYVGRDEVHQPVPAGCKETKIRSGNEMFVRVVCN